MNNRKLIGALLVIVFTTLAFTPDAAAWGDEGHRYINQVAAQRLPDDVPAFLRNAGARLTFLGPEPDRWRDNRELYKALTEVNAPDHFIDIDRRENFAAIPNDRHEYGDWLRSVGKNPKDVGYLPYSILEGYQKVQVLFRMWRDPQYAAEREQIEQNIIYYAGIVGHYVADGANPHHTTIHFNGWATSANPENFTREPLHWRFESDYVKSQMKPGDFSGLVKPATRLTDPFADVMNYIFESNKLVEELYRMDKTARWEGKNTNPRSKTFVAARLAAGAQMLANLWYTAWINSAYGLQNSR